MLVFGIDPGSNATGYAAVRRDRGRYHLVEAGVIRTHTKAPVPQRLLKIHLGLQEALQRLAPDCVAIEAIFKHKSSESALRLGQARGVALLAAAQQGLAVTPYNPMTVKKSVGGHGRATKKEMVFLVSRLLGRLDPLPADAADAAAIAITHINSAALQARLEHIRGRR